MDAGKKIGEKVKLSQISIKSIIISLVFVFFYFQVWSTVRSFLVQDAVQPVVSAMISASGSSYQLFKTNSEVTFHLMDGEGVSGDEFLHEFRSMTDASQASKNTEIFTFKGFGGRFFLICGFALLLFSYYKLFGWLFLFHQAATFLLFFSMAAGLFIHSAFFYVMDLIHLYLIPVFSVIFVLLPMKEYSLNETED